MLELFSKLFCAHSNTSTITVHFSVYKPPIKSRLQMINKIILKLIKLDK